MTEAPRAWATVAAPGDPGGRRAGVFLWATVAALHLAGVVLSGSVGGFAGLMTATGCAALGFAAIGADIDKGASRRHPAEEALHLDRVEAVGAQEQPGVGHIARAIQPPAQPEAPHIRHLAGSKPLIEPSKPPEDPLPGPAVSVEPRHEPVQPPLQGIRAVGAEGAGVVNGGRHRTANPGCRRAVGEDVATLVRRHVRAARIGTPPGYPACGE